MWLDHPADRRGISRAARAQSSAEERYPAARGTLPMPRRAVHVAEIQTGLISAWASLAEKARPFPAVSRATQISHSQTLCADPFNQQVVRRLLSTHPTLGRRSHRLLHAGSVRLVTSCRLRYATAHRGAAGGDGERRWGRFAPPPRSAVTSSETDLAITRIT